MSDKFLGIGRATDLTINSLTISGLDASKPIKTNTDKTLISTKLEKTDVNGLENVLTNPMEQNLNLGNNKIINLTTPTADNDGATKLYVDNSTFKDFSGLRGDTAKINLLTETTQPVYGTIEKYTASSTILAGQPVRPFYGPNGEVQVNAIGGLPTDLHQILGINLNNVLSGEVASVLINGYCTARFIAPVVPTGVVELDDITNGTVQAMSNLIVFTDSGINGNYGPNENYSITFDAGPGRTINWTVNSLGFEHSNSRLYDRLGVQTSTNGITFTSLFDLGYHRTDSDNPPYGSYYFQNGTQNTDIIGTVFPANINFITQKGGSLTKITNARYVKFFFQSDSSEQRAGWNISLIPNIAYGGNQIAVGETLYLDNSNFSRLTLDNTSQLAIGYTAYTDGTNSSIFCKTNISQHS